MTSDSDMGDFSSYEGGLFYENLKGDKQLLGINLEDVTFTHSLVYGLRSNGLRLGYYQFGVGFTF